MLLIWSLTMLTTCYASGNSEGELLATLCGQTAPRVPIVVFTPGLWVQFQTDSSQGDLGFKARYLFSGEAHGPQ